MSVAAPLGLILLAILPVIWWLHRRARPAGDVPFSAFFLVRESVGQGRGGARLRAPWLLALRLLAGALLIAAVLGPMRTPSTGTLVLAAGPVQPDPAWPTPITYVRAGSPPQVEPDPARIVPVAAPPAWGAAALVGQTQAPNARIVRPAAMPPPAAILGGGAEPIDGMVRIVATATAPPTVQIDGVAHPMQPDAGAFAVQLDAPRAGSALIVAEGAQPWPICLPASAPIPVADAGWPPAVEAVLRVLPGVQRVPADQARWRPGSVATQRGWAPFGPPITHFSFGNGLPSSAPAPMWFAADLPPPGAVARRWQRLADPREPLLFAGDAPVVDIGQGAAGTQVRFGFDPADADLPETAGWPVLFEILLTRTRQEVARCRAVRAGQAITLQATAPVTIEGPTGSRVVQPQAGRAVINGLDAQGLYTLTSAGATAWLAVTPTLQTAPPHQPALVTPPASPTPWRAPWGWAAVVLLVGAVLLSKRARSPWAWIAPLLAVAALCLPPLGPPGAVVIAVDTSASIADAPLAAALGAVQQALPDAQRVDGDAAVTGIGPGAPRRANMGTRHAPLLDAARALAQDGGVVVLLSDGRAPDGPVALDLPVITVPIAPGAPDGQIVTAHGVRIGDQVFLRVTVQASAATTGVMIIGEIQVPVQLGPTPRTVQAVLPAEFDVIDVALEVDGDPLPANNRWPVPVDPADPRQAVAVGGGAVGWLEAAGLTARELSAADLSEAGRRLGLMRAMGVHDQPADAFTPEVLGGVLRWVSAGGVLLLAGRDQAFGPGGWAGTPLDRLSPLAADPRQPKARRIALSLALDRSGSMAEAAGGPGPEAVGRLAAHIAAGLADTDRLGVLAFGMQAEPLLAPVAVKSLRATGIRTPSIAQGGTALMPMIGAAIDQLKAADAARRILVVITDGQLTDADQADAAAARLRTHGIRLIAILTGDDPAMQPLQTLAAQTGGIAIRADRAAISRRALAGVLATASDGLFGPGGAVQARGAWAARVGGTPPPVGRRVRVRARPQARVLAAVDGDPLLAEWAIGQGRVIALATDRWDLAADQWAALLSPAAAPRPASAQLSVRDDVLIYTADPRDPPPTAAAIVDGETRHAVAWRSVGPGRAVAPMPPGPVEVLAITTPTAGGAVHARLTRPPPAELRSTGVDRDALRLQAQVTGGRVATLEILPTAVDAVRGRQRRDPLAPWLFALALLALGIEVARWAGIPVRRRAKSIIINA